MSRTPVALAALAWVLAAPAAAQTPSSPQPPATHDHGAPAGGSARCISPRRVRRRCSAEFDRGVALLHSFWFSAAIESFNSVLEGRPALRDGALGHRDELVGQPVRRRSARRRRWPPAWPPSTPREASGAGTDREKAYVGAVELLFRDAATRRPAVADGRLREGDGGAGGQVSRRCRGADLLRPGAGSDGAAHRQDLRQPAEGGGDPRSGVRAPARASRARALHHPQLRRAARWRRARSTRRAATRRSRPTRRTRSTCRRTRSRASARGRSRSTRTWPRRRPRARTARRPEELHALDYQVVRLPADRAGRGGQADARRRSRRSATQIPNAGAGNAAPPSAGYYALRGHSGALSRSSATPGPRRRRSTPRETPFAWADAVTHFARALGAARSGNAAAARAGRRAARRASRRAAEGQRRVLGRAGRDPAARRDGLGGARRRPARPRRWR